MKKDDSVFFFTLVDFLVSTLFFGLVIYAMVGQRVAVVAQAQSTNAANTKRLVESTGVSDLTELTDLLTRLGPVRELAKQKRDFAQLDSLVAATGGIDSVRRAIARLRQAEGYGKPPCRYSTDGTRKIPTDVATLEGGDSTIKIVATTPVFDSIASSLGQSLPAGAILGFTEFRKAVAGVVQREPSCRFFVEFRERTRFVDARDAAASAFRLNFDRR